MKQRINILYILVTCFAFGLAGCSSSSKKDEVITELEEKEIEIDKDHLTAKVGESVEAKIIEVNGDYIVRSLDEKVASVRTEDNTIFAEGVSIGATSILITDEKSNIKAIPIGVYEFEEILLEDNIDEIEFSVRLGHSESKSVEITQGNGKYTTKIADNGKDMISVKIVEDKTLQISVAEGSNGGETVVTLFDRSGFEKSIPVKVTTTTEPYTEEEIEDIKNLKPEEQIYELNGYGTTIAFEYSDKIEDNIRTIIAIEKSWWADSIIYINFPADSKVGVVKNGKILFDMFPNYGDSSGGEIELDYLEILEDGDTYIKAIFSYINKNNVLQYGRLILDKTKF